MGLWLSDEEQMMREDFIAFKQYYREAIAKVPADAFYRQTINHKFKHSIEVLHIGQTILKETSELKKKSAAFKRRAEIALLFHDVGRFEEACLQYADETKNKVVSATTNTYDHGLIGYKLLKQNKKYNDARILFALKWHGKTTSAIEASKDWHKAAKEPHFNELKQILFLVRDADKLANLYHIKTDNHLEKDLFYRQLTNAALHAPLSPHVLNEFYQERKVSFANVYSFADRILMVISWIFDLNYEASRKIFKQNAYDVFLIKLLKKYHKNTADITAIKQFIKNP